MPHDKNGTLLTPGDVVTITCRVKVIQPQADYCNASVELDPMPPYTEPYTLSVNTRQLVKVAPTEPAPNAPAITGGGANPGGELEP